MTNLDAVARVLSNPSWDVVALLVFVAVGFFYGISSGRARLIAVLMSLYVSALLFENFRFIDVLIGERGMLEIFLFRLAVFAVLVIVLSLLFSKVFSVTKTPQKWWKIFLLSFLEVGLFVSIVFRFLPSVELFTFSPLVQYLFASPDAFFWWLLLPLPALFLIMRKAQNTPR